MEPVETTTPLDRQLYQLEFSVPEGRDRHSIPVSAGLLAPGATDKRSHHAWTAARAAVVASRGATP
jgi:hypothetical protein